MFKHQQTHPNLDVPGCFACRITGVSISAAATPSRRAATVDIMDRDAGFDKDAAAYRRLRKNRVQPKNIKGSAILEKHADTKDQIEGNAKRPKL